MRLFFLLKELEILMPQIIVSQGKNANKIMSNLLRMPGNEDSLPAAKIVHIGKARLYGYQWIIHHTIQENPPAFGFLYRCHKKWIIENSADSINTLSEEFTLTDQPGSEQQFFPSEISNESITQVIEAEPDLGQPGFSDFGLYKCEVCGKMVMGFEKANHETGKTRREECGLEEDEVIGGVESNLQKQI